MIIHCKFAHEIWSHLVVTHEGTSQVKRAKIDLLRSQYENFSMNGNDSIDNMSPNLLKSQMVFLTYVMKSTMTKR